MKTENGRIWRIPSIEDHASRRQLPGTGHRRRNVMTPTIDGIAIPDSTLARAITELVRDTETPLLFNHSSRVYYWGALAGKRRGLTFDRQLPYAGAMFHDIGLIRRHSSADERFEVDGGHVARDVLRAHGIAQTDI